MVSKHFTRYLEFPDNQALARLLGPTDIHIHFIEKKLQVEIALKGNKASVTGSKENVTMACGTLQYLYELSLKNRTIDEAQVDSAIHFSSQHHIKVENADHKRHTDDEVRSSIELHTRRRIIQPRTQNQTDYLDAIFHHDLVFGIGPAGCGKTYLAVAAAVSMLLSGKIEKIILSRPAVEAGERLGFLPGDMREKVDPYLRPLYDALNDMLPSEQVMKRIATGDIEIAPLAFMRGRTLTNAFIILDEAQNTTTMQMKMFLTRLGAYGRMVINGDLTQVDLPLGVESGLKEASHVLKHVDGLKFVHFDEEDIVRHPLVSKIVKAYAKAFKN